jgi:thermopsin
MRRVVIALVVAALMVISTLVVFNAATPGAAHSAPSASAESTAPAGSTSPVTSSPERSVPNDGVVEASAARAAGIASARQAFLKAGGNLSDFHPPSVNAPVRPASATGGHIVPLYDEAPAPMGIATYGLQSSGGKVTPYVLNTTSVEGYFSTTDPTGVQVQSYDLDGQTTYGAQLNAIEVGTTLDGQTSFRGNTNEFWLQNTISYDPEMSSNQLTFDFEIWNFSYNNQANLPWAGFSLLPSTSILHGQGQVYGDEVYDSGGGPFITVSYPFTLELYLNTTVGSFHGGPPVNEVYVNYSVFNADGQRICPTHERTGAVCGEYDNVYFNSGAPVAPGSAEIQANGYHYAGDGNGTNLDIEFDYGIGNYNAAIADTVYADATLRLLTLNSATGRYQEVPSAYDFGSETGETTMGSFGTWSVGASGSPVEHLTTGPSFLSGLWNASGVAGAHALNYQGVEPQNAWVAIARGAGVTNQMVFRIDPTFGWFNRPTSGGELGPNTWLPPGVYTVEVMLSGYATVTQTVDLTHGNAVLAVALVRDPSSTTYTPLDAFSNAQLAAIATSGSGTAADPYHLWNSQKGSVAPVFGDLSQWPFEVWEGIYVNATTAHAVWAPLPSLSITYPWWEVQFLDTAPDTAPLPLTNQLQIFLYHTQNLTIYGSPDIGGWFAYSAASGYNLIANGVRNVLIADNQFDYTNLGLEFYGGGGNNTVWGNSFTPDDLAATYGVYPPFEALTVYQSGDHIYNNAFYTDSPASSPSPFSNSWNVTCVHGYTAADYLAGEACEPLSYYQIVNGYRLSGSIIGSDSQGGNYWLNYGNDANPYGSLPYDNRPSYAPGSPQIGSVVNGVGTQGDYAPLLPASLHRVSFIEGGLPIGTSWSVTLTNSTGYSFRETSTAGERLSFYLPAGTYHYAAPSTRANGAWFATSEATGPIKLSSPVVIVPLEYALGYAATFSESGLPVGMTWHLEIPAEPSAGVVAHSSTSSIVMGLLNGTYTYRVVLPSDYRSIPSGGTFSVTGRSVSIPLAVQLVSYAVTFRETGLPAGTDWEVSVAGVTHSSHSSTVVFDLGNGTYSYAATAAGGYAANPAAGSLTVSGSPSAPVNLPFGVASPVQFSESGLPISGGFEWTLNVAGQVPAPTVSSEITVSLPAGTYRYTVTSSSTYLNFGGTSSTGYSPSPARGTFRVQSSPVFESVSFHPTRWSVTFYETGLPTGTEWSVTVVSGAGTITHASDGSSMVLRLVNGTYGYSISTVPGYTTTSSGEFLLWGAPLSVEVTFQS